MGAFLFLQNTVGCPKAVSEPPDGHAIAIIDQYALGAGIPDGVDGLLLSQHLDERHLSENAPLLETFLDRGGAIVLNGPVARCCVTGLSPHEALPASAPSDWHLELAEPHPVTDGVAAEDLTFRRGVVGFWARGTLPPPTGSIVLTRFARSGRPADYIWHRPSGGRVLVHPGNDLWGYAGGGTSAARVYPQVLNWIGAAS